MEDQRLPRATTNVVSHPSILALVWLLTAVLVWPGGWAAQPASAATLPPPPAPLISRNVPAFASSEEGGAARNANDGDYATFWRSVGTPAWLAYDLSSVPAAQRGQVVVAWYNDPMTPDYDPVLIGKNAYNLPTAYTLEANAAAGGAPPAAGWQVLVTVTDNIYHSRQHLVNLSGYNWVRINVSTVRGVPGNTDVALNLDVHDASQGAQDDWMFYGDYISAAGFDHAPRGVGAFAQIINASQPGRFPIQETGGTAYMQSGDGARLMKAYLNLFPGQFVALSFGTTDADFFAANDPNLPADFYGNYVTMVQAVLAAGKTPVVPKIPWGRTPNAQANIPRLNAKIADLYTAYPQIIHGPDLYAYFAGHQDQIAADGLNPTDAGFAALRQQWAQQMLQNVYGPGGGPPPPPPGSGSCSDGQLFPETGKCVRQPFLAYWQAHGALAINGYPISDAFTETLEDGKPYTVQYFERVRMEYHPENADPQYQVLLGQFGRRIHPADPPAPQLPGAVYFQQTGHNLTGGFLAYWQANGGLAQFGFPISEVFGEQLEDGHTYQVQYFERARFEYHPENQPPYDIELGQFGRRILGNR